MPKFHKKQSKRMSCKRRYKIVKKVAEHNRKLKREKRKNPGKAKAKDPGIPNSLPFKDEILREAEQRKQRAKDLKEAQKASRTKLQMQSRGIEDLVVEAAGKSDTFVPSNLSEENAQSCSSKFKSYHKEFKKVVEAADVILEVLDARDPLGSRCPQVEQLVVSSGKRLVLLLNKIDLIPKSNLDEWLKYLRQELPTVAFKSSTQNQHDHLSQSKVAAIHITESLQSSRRCVGAAFLMKLLGNYCRNQNIQTFIKIGVVGFPNVGKSSVINSLKRSRSCLVGSMPGVTKSVQEVSLDKHIKILDSPGVVFAKDGSAVTLALRNAVKVETLKDVISPAEAIIQRSDHTQLCVHYCIPQFSSTHELLCLLAKKMGKYKKGGIPNSEDGARRLIKDWNSGKIKYYTHPPEEFKQSTHISAEYVSEMGKAFDISLMEEQMELDKAPEIFPSEGVAVKAAEPTEGFIPGEVEEMEIVNEKVTVEFEPKKKKNVIIDDDPKLLMTGHQQNKLIKNKFKKLKRKLRKNDKVAASLSDSLGCTLNFE